MEREDSLGFLERKSKAQLIQEIKALRGRVAELDGVSPTRNPGEFALVPSEEKYRALVETTGTGFVIIDGAGRVLDANAEYVRLTGHQRLEEILGKPVTEWTAERERERNAQAVRQCLAEGKIRGLEITYVDTAGKETPIVVNATVVEDRGAPLILTLCRDITLRKQMETEILESKGELEGIYESIIDGLVIADVESGRLVHVNEPFCAMFGYSEEETLALANRDLHPPKDVPWVMEHFSTLVEGREKTTNNIPCQRKDGSVFYADIGGMPLVYRGRRCINGFFRDVSERRRHQQEIERLNADLEKRVDARTAQLARALQELRDIGQRDSTILNTTLDGFCIVDMSGNFVEVNEAFCAMIGYTRDELLAMSVSDVEAIETPESSQAHMRRIREQGADRFETLHRRRDGQMLNVEACVTSLPEAGGFCGFFRDITDRKQAEEDLRRLNRALRIFSECNQIIARTVDELELLQGICSVIVKIGGYGLAWVGFAEENEHRSVRPAAWSADRPGYIEGIRVTWDETESGRGPAGTAIRTGEPVFTRDTRTDPGFKVWRDAALAHGYLSIISLPLKTTERVIGALLVYAHQVEAFDTNETELLARLADNLTHGIMALRMRAERDDARQKLESLARLPGENPDPVMRIAQDGILLYANRASTPILEQFGLEIGHVIPETWRAWMVAALETERNKEVELEYGSRFFSILLAPIAKSGYANVYWRDITARVTAEKLVVEQRVKMIEGSRLSSLGTMAGGIAHEVNNPLAIIAGCAEQLEELVTSEDMPSEIIIERTQMVRRNADRIQRIVQGLRNLSRDASADPFVSVQVSDIIAGTLEICQNRLRDHDIWLDIMSPIPAVSVECRPAQISQLLLNLFNNSFDAVENLPRKWIRLGVVDLGDHAQISVTDSGPGIPKDIADNLFVPFFTTKSEQRGLGLGLSISHAIVEAHHGEISVDTMDGNTRFIVSLPKKQPPSAT